ncbi:hypothetical protein [Intestinimonas butyriciproducens]|uniref:hypothetical protein n=1 Tax=Intestinimonas butyriciproducens TaxID=1297617 RepID=UPI001AB03AE3|nr:hypothetical protein [Intestinimonas butyriciproducens]MBO3280825.1 hypothetical protein [Intestinimonas butyriciproducens]
MTWRERLAAAWGYPRLREELAETRKELADSRGKCAQLEDDLLRLVAKCDGLSDTAQRRGDTLARTRQSMEAFRAALLSFCPELNSVERLRQFYDCVAPEFDPDGFHLYFAAEEITGIRNLYECFPYEDACGCFEEADGHALLRYLTATHFEAVSWEVVPGTTYERAVLQEVDTSTAEYQAFERQLYAKALERMGFHEFLPPEPGKVQEQTKQRNESR